jgi:hypothetical protein
MSCSARGSRTCSRMTGISPRKAFAFCSRSRVTRCLWR